MEKYTQMLRVEGATAAGQAFVKVPVGDGQGGEMSVAALTTAVRARLELPDDQALYWERGDSRQSLAADGTVAVPAGGEVLLRFTLVDPGRQESFKRYADAEMEAWKEQTSSLRRGNQ